MKDEIESRLGANLERVQNLVELHRNGLRGRNQRRLAKADVLRAAVVLLHATLEDFLRSLLEWKLPDADAVHLRDVPLAGKKPRSTFTLDDLAAFRGTSVDEVIVQSVRASLERSNFNDSGQIERALVQIGLPSTVLAPHKDELGALMARRHWVVHRLDRDTSAEPGEHATLAIERTVVDRWFSAVRQLTAAVLEESRAAGGPT